MSYDVAVVLPPIPERDAKAWAAFDIETQQKGRPPAIFRKLHDRIVVRFPCLSSLRNAEADESPWSFGPLLSGFGKRAAVLSMVYSRVDEVLPFVIDTAHVLGLPVFDLGSDQIHRPDGIKGISLTVEDKPALRAPTLQQIEDAVDSLTRRGGPGFVIVEGPKNYAQAAGGKGAYTAEWRAHSGRKFRHWVAGQSGRPAKKNIAIPTNGFEVTVKENERLTADHVKLILSAFAAGKAQPEGFVWRDVTDRFA